MIPAQGWQPMVYAPRDIMRAIVVRYRHENKPTGEIRIQFARWLPNPFGEWAFRPCWRPDGGTVHADAWMSCEDYQAACNALDSTKSPEFDL